MPQLKATNERDDTVDPQYNLLLGARRRWGVFFCESQSAYYTCRTTAAAVCGLCSSKQYTVRRAAYTY